MKMYMVTSVIINMEIYCMLQPLGDTISTVLAHLSYYFRCTFIQNYFSIFVLFAIHIVSLIPIIYYS